MWTLKVNCETSSEHFNGAGQNILDISLALLLLTKVSGASIAGVTYMDDFDFEQRYRNFHECDPFYWHPLHLPDECAEMFANLIRSKIRTPYRVVKEREPYRMRRIYRNELGTNAAYYDYSNSQESYEAYGRIPEYAVPIEAELKLYQSRPLNPFDKLFELMRRDVEENPSAPRVTSIPYIGGVALYRQPVSFKTKAMIKTLSQAYAKAAYQT